MTSRISALQRSGRWSMQYKRDGLYKLTDRLTDRKETRHAEFCPDRAV